MLSTILSKDYDLITRRDYETIMAMPEDEAATGLQTIVGRQLALQHGKTAEALAADPAVNGNVIPNALIFSLGFIDSGFVLPLVLDVLRQTDAIVDFNLHRGHADDFNYALPVLWEQSSRSAAIRSFLLEPTHNLHGKQIVADFAARVVCASDGEALRQQYRQIIRDVLAANTAHVDALQARSNKSAPDANAVTPDSGPAALTDSASVPDFSAAINAPSAALRQMLSYMVNAAADAGLADLAPTVERLYALRIVDETICGPIDNALFGLHNPAYMDAPSTDPYHLLFAPTTEYSFG